MANAQVTVTSADNGMSRSTVTDANGHWTVVGLPSGNYKAMAERTGFKTVVYNVNYNSSQPAVYDFTLGLGSTAETVEVVGQAPTIDTSTAMVMTNRQPQKLAPGAVAQNASENVLNLQKRVAGVLPVPIDVPRAGTSFSFVRPLVLDEETKVTGVYNPKRTAPLTVLIDRRGQIVRVRDGYAAGDEKLITDDVANLVAGR